MAISDAYNGFLSKKGNLRTLQTNKQTKKHCLGHVASTSLQKLMNCINAKSDTQRNNENRYHNIFG